MLFGLPAGSSVDLYRTQTKIWDRTHILVRIEEETVIVKTPAGKIFRSNCVRPVRKLEWPKKRTEIYINFFCVP